jgi:hypothetical protein
LKQLNDWAPPNAVDARRFHDGVARRTRPLATLLFGAREGLRPATESTIRRQTVDKLAQLSRLEAHFGAVLTFGLTRLDVVSAAR